MPTSQPGANRHQLRVWLKWAIESGLLDRVPPRYDPEGSGDPQPIADYARPLLAELKERESSRGLLRDPRGGAGIPRLGRVPSENEPAHHPGAVGFPGRGGLGAGATASQPA